MNKCKKQKNNKESKQSKECKERKDRKKVPILRGFSECKIGCVRFLLFEKKSVISILRILRGGFLRRRATYIYKTGG
jgi:hypothetical protein